MTRILSTISVVAVSGGGGSDPVFVSQPPSPIDFTMGVTASLMAAKVTDPDGDPLTVGMVAQIAGVTHQFDQASGQISLAWDGTGAPGDYDLQFWAEDAKTGGTSPDGTTIPPATSIIMADGAVWTLGAGSPEALRQTLRNGVQAGGGWAYELLKWAGLMYARNPDWWVFDELGRWQPTSDPRVS